MCLKKKDSLWAVSALRGPNFLAISKLITWIRCIQSEAANARMFAKEAGQ